MVTFPEAHLTCPSCNAVVPWSQACINCGSRLPQRPPQADPFDALKDTLRGGGSKERATEELMAAVPELSPEEEPEGRLAKYMLLRVKVLEMADRGEISHEAFTGLYKGYMGKTVEAMEKYADVGDKVNEAHEILVETRSFVEGKQEQRERGEITTEEFMAEFNRLRNVIDKISGSINRLRTQRETLGIGGGTEQDILKLKGLQRKLHHYRSYIPAMVASDSMPKAMQGTVHSDLTQMIELFDSNVDWVYEHDEPEIQIAEEYAEPGEAPELFGEAAEPTPDSMYTFEQPNAEEKPVYVFGATLAPPAEEVLGAEDEAFKEITKQVKGHDDEIRRLLRAVRLGDNVLLLGPHGEGKTETMLQLQRHLGGVYMHCSEETTERELVTGFNPGAFVGRDPVHNGLLMKVAQNEEKMTPIAYIDDVTKLRPRTQAILYEAMNSKTFTDPVDGTLHRLPDGFCVVAAGALDCVTQDTPDPGLLDRFGKTILWGRTPIESIQGLLARYALPVHIFTFAIWVKQEVDRMRYLVPVSTRNLLKFAREYNAYREVYQSRDEAMKLAVDRLLKMRVLNTFGVEEYEEARRRVYEYAWDSP
ncbi:MoxR family ATPase [Candidatus Bathyarchaeota archaeon]|nr:MoxR family ATPase [Candidatus Bathyarchaeota archaeon]